MTWITRIIERLLKLNESNSKDEDILCNRDFIMLGPERLYESLLKWRYINSQLPLPHPSENIHTIRLLPVKPHALDILSKSHCNAGPIQARLSGPNCQYMSANAVYVTVCSIHRFKMRSLTCMACSPRGRAKRTNPFPSVVIWQNRPLVGCANIGKSWRMRWKQLLLYYYYYAENF